MAHEERKSKICKICGDEIGIMKENGEMFVACLECGFPVCQPCYDYERTEGHHSCPQCHTRYKRHQGSFPYPSILIISGVARNY